MTGARTNIDMDTAADLARYVARVERLNEEITGLQADKSDIFQEAKSRGFDPKVMKQVIARRKKAAADLSEEEALLELYEAAIAKAERGGAPRAHAPAREAAADPFGED